MDELTPEELRKAERDRQDKEKMSATTGLDPDDPVDFAKYQNVQSRLLLKKIDESAAAREVASYEALKKHKETVAEAKQRSADLVRGSSEADHAAPAIDKKRDWRDRASGGSAQQLQHRAQESRNLGGRTAGDQEQVKPKEVEADWRPAAREVTDRLQGPPPPTESKDRSQRESGPQGPPRRPPTGPQR